MAVELANGLARLGHSVSFCSLLGSAGREHWQFDTRVRFVIPQVIRSRRWDAVLITSPHSIHLGQSGSSALINHKGDPTRVFLHLQMLEHLFRPDNAPWVARCLAMYQSPHPLFSISSWNIRDLRALHGRTGETIYVGNGVNLDHFPLEHGERRDKRPTVLVEGWEAYNPTKDVDRLAPRVVRQLREDGCRILAYGGVPLKTETDVPHEYHCRPSLPVLNGLYARAHILVKATRYDARSCAPMEAMTKGTPTVRAIIEGDDDLEHGVNCLRVPYDGDQLLQEARRLLRDAALRERLGRAGHAHLKANSWDRWVKFISDRMSR